MPVITPVTSITVPKKVKPFKESHDFLNGFLFDGFLFKPVAQNFIKNGKVATTFGAQEGTRTPTKLLAST